ncbi:cyclic nucleotide-binding domain-containing protein [Permianibacter sp. IMCC34836]|uniref:Crp/Fnr family transcriptional regulator n=1 Tax=Permianibacter fluminis TaxID=2738515 RepID=UPI0015532B17|nr:cyclic nucleotide-binding domain-containing protein [Permianibacter fluminis]NQD38918.1 cyclic nucleotide-binding domain-containing protein [Permianibacter fluminis]
MIPLVEPTTDLMDAVRAARDSAAHIFSERAADCQQVEMQAEDDILSWIREPALCRVESGSVAVFAENKLLFYWDEGDAFATADFIGVGPTLRIQVEDSVTLSVLPQALLAEAADIRGKYEALLRQHRQILLLLVGRLVTPEERPQPGFRRFADGEAIITQGDEAEYVYTILEGVADVSVDGVNVGVINEEEIFGAMAVLTGQRRAATVRARGTCSVMMVARDEFASLVNTHPQLFINLLRDMTRTIVSLNERVVSLDGR